MQTSDCTALKVRDRVGKFELFEVVEREYARLYRFRGAGVSFGIEWPYRTQPPTHDDFRFIVESATSEG